MSTRRALMLFTLLFAMPLQLLAEGSATPAYKVYTPEEFRELVRVVAGRGKAWIGFNAPEVTVLLPRSHNSIFSVVEFGPARLLDEKGKEVPYELENGGHNIENDSDEIRFKGEDSDQIVEFARAVGTLTVRYPLVIETVTVKKGNPAPKGLKVEIDGSKVTYSTGTVTLPEPASFSRILPLRAYNKAGEWLTPEDSGSTLMEGEETFRRFAFQGQIGSVQLDQVRKWATLNISYDLPPAPRLPDAQSGLPQPRPDGKTAGSVVKTLVVE